MVLTGYSVQLFQINLMNNQHLKNHYHQVDRIKDKINNAWCL